MLVIVGLEDSDELFKELDDFIMNVDLDGCEEESKVVEVGEEKDVDKEIRELLGEEVGTGIECLRIDIDKITSDNLEDFLKVNDDQDTNEKREQGGKASKEQVNALSIRSGFGYGDEEERNENKNEKIAELGIIAQQHPNELRSSGHTEPFPSFVAQSVASQSVPLRSNDPEQPRNDPKVDLEVGNQVGNEPILQSKVKELKINANTSLKAYKLIPKLEVKMKPPDVSKRKVQGMNDFIDKLIVYLSGRMEESFGKVGEENFHDDKGRCKCVCMYVGYLMMVVILANTKKWNDAIVKVFEKFFVAMETCDGYNIVCFICLF